MPKRGPTSTSRITPVHTAVPGRARLQIQGLYRNDALCRRLEHALEGVDGIRFVQGNPLTGRVLILFDSGHGLDRLIGCIEKVLDEQGAKPSSRVSQEPSRKPSGMVREMRQFAKAVRHPSGKGQRSAPQAVFRWHAEAGKEALERCQTDPREGLSYEEAMTRLMQYGPNQLAASRGRSPLSIFLSQFATLPVAMLAVSAGVSVATGGLLDAGVILGVVLINSVIGYVTEAQAERTIQSLTGSAARTAQVLREGVEQSVAGEELVPGDVVVLTPGAYVGADLRLLKCHRLTVDESALTGESLPVTKQAEAVLAADTPLGDRINMAYMGTTVTGGSGMGVVIATREASEIGQIQALVGKARPPETPMQRQLGRMGTQLGVLSGLVCTGVFVAGILRGQGMLQMLKSSVSLAVAAVPEGLPAVATTTLALGINAMRSHNVAVRHLDAVESLGAVQVFCMDKTGTLTLNHMTVVDLRFADGELRVKDGDVLDGEQVLEVEDWPGLRRLLEVVSLCSETELEGESGAYDLQGSPTENGLVELALQQAIDVPVLRERFAREKVYYRSEHQPYMRTVHAHPRGGRLLAIKGSPREVLDLCSHYLPLHGADPEALDDELRERLLGQNETMAGEALRVLAVAFAAFEGENVPRQGFTWVGLVGMADPLREGMAELIGVYHQAGIRTVMITGDQGPTAYAIGKQLGLSGDQPLKILDSTHLEKMDAELLAALVEDVHVFARVSPSNKLEIVQALQRTGQVVAMTGDGINDGPALKAADVGVAMGEGGTDVARSVSDVVLEDNNLLTMSAAIRQGRTIYGNIRKTIHYLLSTNFSEIEVMLGGIVLGLGQPLNPMQLLWINLATDIFPGLALSLEPPEPGVMSRPPRDPQEAILRPRDLRRMGLESAVITGGTLAGYLYALKRYGAGPQASTLAFNILTHAQLMHSLSCRSEQRQLFSFRRRAPNRQLLLAVGGTALAQVLINLSPGMRRLIGIAPLGPLDWLVVAAGAVGPVIINELSKPAPLSPGKQATKEEETA